MIDGFGVNAGDLARVASRLDALNSRVFPEASRLALNDVAFKVMYENRDLMKRVFDNPSPWTLSAFFVRKATLANMSATVERKTNQAGRHFLEVQSDGGKRPLTGLERLLTSRLKYNGLIQAVLPSKHARKDRRGNVSRGQINQILSAVQAQGDSAANTTKASKSRARNRNRAAYFVPRTDSKLSPGVYQRKGDDIKKMLAFSDVAPTYDLRFPMEEHAQKVAAAEIEPAFERAFRTALART